MSNLINYSWKRCKNFRFFCFLLPRTHWYTHQIVGDYMLTNSIENFEAWKIDLHGDMAKNAKRVWSMINFVNFVFSSLWITAQPVYSSVLLKNIVYDFALESQVSQGEPQKSGYMKHVRIGPEYPTIYGYIRFYLDISQCFALSAITAWQSEWFFSLYVGHFEFPIFWPVLLKIYRCFCGQLAEYTVIWVYWKKWIKFHIHFSAVFPDCLGAKGSIRRLAPTTELESRVCWLGLLALEIEINTSAT